MTTIPDPFTAPAVVKSHRSHKLSEANGVDGWPAGNWRDTAITFGNVRICVALITPEMAQRWVDETKKRNRSKTKSRIAMYARDMKADEWDFNGDPIRRDVNNDLIDGQHRAYAVIEAGTPQPFLLVEGLLPETQDTMDSGRSRSITDVLTIHDEPDPNLLSSVTRRLALFFEGVPATGGGRQLSRRESLRFIAEHPEIHRAVEVGREAVAARVPVAPSVIGTAYYLCAERDREAAELFFVTNLIKSLGIDVNDEHHPARTLLRRFRTEEKTGGKRIDPEQAFRLTLQAWNAWRSGRKLERTMTPTNGWPPYSKIIIR